MKLSRINSRTEFFKRFPVVIRLPVQWGDMDAYKHVNNSVYFKYQESARLSYFKALTDEIDDPKFDVDSFRNGTGLGPILSETTMKFIYPVVWPDTLLIGATAHMVEDTKNRFIMFHSIWSLSNNRTVAQGTGTVASFNYAIGKAQDFDPRIVSAVHSLAAKDSSHVEEKVSTLL